MIPGWLVGLMRIRLQPDWRSYCITDAGYVSPRRYDINRKYVIRIAIHPKFR